MKCFTAFRLATVSELFPLLTGHFSSPHQLWRHACRLSKNGYLAEPPAQLLRMNAKRGRPAHIYALGTKGARILRDQGIILPRADFTAKAKALKFYSLEHPLAVTRAVLPFLLALRASSTQALRTFYPDGSVRETIRTRYRDHDVDLPLCPDGVFLLEHTTTHERFALLLEVDRATEPNERTHAAQTSFLKKVVAYRAYHALPDRVTRELEAEDFIVLTIAPTTSRLETLRTVVRSGDLFWFTTAAELARHNPLVDPIWTTPEELEPGILF